MLIGLSGKSRSGKDLVGKIIQYLMYESKPSKNNKASWEMVTKFGDMEGFLKSVSGWEIKKFADKLKLGLQYDFPTEFNKDVWEKGGDEYREGIMPSLDMTRRKALQLRGEKCREIHEDYWVNTLMNEYKEYDDIEPSSLYPIIHKLSKWIISDTRFENEAKAIKDKGGVLIRIERPSIISTDMHESETSLDRYEGFDVKLDNDRDIEGLIGQVRAILKTLRLI